ncbi:MAG: wax ester/triacylglycerol synthase family O-acyltransferase [Humibacillus sp.]|nr:wax ester/triacylglycerol synthase family O-acyltransferase [Humibacillus sp.]MDN5776147.1 wax ester/triacylglycerol synthase family O-acyltransferase [Humibacillus sp.]
MQRLSPLDVSFLHLERPVQQLNVGSVLIFEGAAPTYDELCAAVEVLLPAFPRYRQRVRRVPLDLALPVWVEDGGFRLRDHVGHRQLPSPGTDEALRTLAVALISQPIDLERPLWHTWLVTGLDGGRFALVNTNHHAMIDGVSGADIISVLLTTSPEPPARQVPPEPWAPGPEPSVARLVTDALVEIGSSPVRAVQGLGRALHPKAIPESLAELVGMARFGEQMAHLEFGLNGSLGPSRDWRWVRASLDEVKAVKNCHGGTVNDVVLAAVAGGFRALLLSRGQSVDGRTVRTMVPVSTRDTDERGALGNRVSAVFADLPVGQSNPLERLHAVSAQLHTLKTGGTAMGVDALLSAADLLPAGLYGLGVRAWAHSPQRVFSTVTTNVPGPQVPLYLLGRRMTDLIPYIPLGAELRITVGIASYAGGLAWGVTGDHDSVPDLHVLSDGIEASIAELISLTPPSTRSEVRHA